MALTRAVDVARFAITGSFEADGYNIGINIGEAAGQTVFHLHLHVIPHRRYRRDAIPSLFGLSYSERAWGQGLVRQGNYVFLFVTLDKTGHDEAFQYKDHFISPTEFEWQSQNRTTQKSSHGQLIRYHNEHGATIRLFVRAKAKTKEGKGESFVYCGPVEFQSWSEESPITLPWKIVRPSANPTLDRAQRATFIKYAGSARAK